MATAVLMTATSERDQQQMSEYLALSKARQRQFYPTLLNYYNIYMIEL